MRRRLTNGFESGEVENKLFRLVLLRRGRVQPEIIVPQDHQAFTAVFEDFRPFFPQKPLELRAVRNAGQDQIFPVWNRHQKNKGFRIVLEGVQHRADRRPVFDVAFIVGIQDPPRPCDEIFSVLEVENLCKVDT